MNLKDIVQSIELKDILIFILAAAGFRMLLYIINNMNPRILSVANKVPEKWKGRWLIEWGVFLILIIIVAFFVVYFKLSALAGTIIAAFISAITDFVFVKSKRFIKKL